MSRGPDLNLVTWSVVTKHNAHTIAVQSSPPSCRDLVTVALALAAATKTSYVPERWVGVLQDGTWLTPWLMVGLRRAERME